MQLCSTNPDISMLYSRNPDVSDSDTFLGAGPTANTSHHFGTLHFASSRVLMQSFQDFDSRNSKMVNGRLTSTSIVLHLSASLTPLVPHHPFSLQDFAFHDIMIPVAKFMGLPPTKSRNRNPLANPMALVAWIYGPNPPEIRTF
jgi:hypothetical protein